MEEITNEELLNELESIKSQLDNIGEKLIEECLAQGRQEVLDSLGEEYDKLKQRYEEIQQAINREKTNREPKGKNRTYEKAKEFFGKIKNRFTRQKALMPPETELEGNNNMSTTGTQQDSTAVEQLSEADISYQIEEINQKLHEIGEEINIAIGVEDTSALFEKMAKLENRKQKLEDMLRRNNDNKTNGQKPGIFNRMKRMLHRQSNNEPKTTTENNTQGVTGSKKTAYNDSIDAIQQRYKENQLQTDRAAQFRQNFQSQTQRQIQEQINAMQTARAQRHTEEWNKKFGKQPNPDKSGVEGRTTDGDELEY